MSDDREPLPEFATINGNPSGYTEKLQAFVASRGIELEYSERITPAKGLSSGGKITLLPDLSPAEHFAVLAHEVAHELLHKSERRAKTTPTVRETEAEAVAFVVSTAIGLDLGTASSDQMYDGDKEMLAESLTSCSRRPLKSCGPSRRSSPKAKFRRRGSALRSRALSPLLSFLLAKGSCTLAGLW